MENKKSIALFENKEVMRHYDEATETLLFSVVDIVAGCIPNCRKEPV
ncbi:MAG: hypothetical protein IPG01_05000 [Chitinophagaceae bacterium]|nr:hypothetical protein [Chitinophagaceae bacterium]